ncbi:hypothetical protein B9Z19DRAFT_793361 [Tuber borchii]|uniref:Uncharacterized protein n=1 Tax=Tuber borchii TaxID=42251 RepID=A0A2T6ZWA9_TUBBO|nr:hypothetical protein B9Z19DRAFT_793361 [Tuber borchii]
MGGWEGWETSNLMKERVWVVHVKQMESKPFPICPSPSILIACPPFLLIRFLHILPPRPTSLRFALSLLAYQTFLFSFPLYLLFPNTVPLHFSLIPLPSSFPITTLSVSSLLFAIHSFTITTLFFSLSISLARAAATLSGSPTTPHTLLLSNCDQPSANERNFCTAARRHSLLALPPSPYHPCRAFSLGPRWPCPFLQLPLYITAVPGLDCLALRPLTHSLSTQSCHSFCPSGFFCWFYITPFLTIRHSRSFASIYR